MQVNAHEASGHCIQSNHTGTPCGELNEELYIEDCDYERQALQAKCLGKQIRKS